MLAKKFRLPIQQYRLGKKNKDTITKKGKFFIAKITPNDLNFSRFGIVISAKAVNGAVKRNRLKRIFFNFIRLNRFQRILGKDILLIILSSVGELTKSQIENELLSFIKSSSKKQ